MKFLIKLLQDLRSPHLKDHCEDLIKKYSMRPIAPVLHSFPFFSVHKNVEPYVLFLFEAIRVLSLAISRTIKEFLIQILGDTTRITSALKGLNGESRIFKQTRKLALRWMIVFLRETHETSSGYGLTIDFSKGDNVGGSTGFFFKARACWNS